MLVAPVGVDDRAYTGAGSVITKDVPPGALGIARERQRNIEGYMDRRKEREASSGGGSASGPATSEPSSGGGSASGPATSEPSTDEPPSSGPPA
jgi:bifunctional UDP-N-acetylglucosamine pyrophosphorylase/glucosamine-1-phosphate N-acetyltransferase